MSLEMSVVVEAWENRTGLKVASVIAIRGQVIQVTLRGKEDDPRVKDLQEKLKGYEGEYNGHRNHRTKHRQRDWRGGDQDSHTNYRGELKGYSREEQRKKRV